MKYFVTFTLFAILFLPAKKSHAQKRQYSVTGTIQDSAEHHPLPLATVYVRNPKDSSLISFALTDEKGRFILKSIPKDTSLSFMVFYTGYKKYFKPLKNINRDTLKLGIIPLAMQANALDEVTITGAKPPIVIKGDTIEFNASSFHTRPNSVLAGLLKKLPGVEIDENGSITANGKKVDKIMVNGKAFFGDDPKIALQNLPAAIIDKVQVTDTKTRKEEVMGLPAGGDTKTINVTLKKGKDHGFFGRAYAGYGTDDHYDASALLNYFNGDRQISLLGATNNINQVGFTMNEIGGLFSGGPRRITYSSNGSFGVNGITLGGGGTGIKRSTTAGVNYNDDLGKYLSLNGSYFYGNIKNDNETKVARQNILPDSIFYYNSDNISHHTNLSHRINFNLRYDDDSLWNIFYRPSVELSNADGINNSSAVSTNEKGAKINESNSHYISHATSKTFSNDLNIFRTLNKKGQSINLRLNSSNRKTENNDFNTFKNMYYTGSSPDDSANQNIRQNITSDMYRAEFEFSQPLSKKLSLNAGYNLEWQKGLTDKNTFDFNSSSDKYNITDSAYSNKFRSSTLTQTPVVGLRFTTDSSNWNIYANANFNFIHLDHYSYTHDVGYKNNQFFIAPSIYITRKTKDKASIRLQYSSYIRQPDISQLLPVADNTNPLYIVKGNPELKPSVSNNIRLSYNKFDFKSGNSIWGSLDFGTTGNDIIRVTSYDDQLRQLTTYTNVDGNKNASLYLSLSKSKKNQKNHWRVRLNTSGRYHYQHAFVNKTAYTSNGYNLTARPSVSYGVNDLFELTPSYRLSYQYTKYDIDALNNRENIRQELQFSGSLYWPGRLTWTTDVNYTHNSNVAPGFSKGYWLWNASVGLDIFKNRQATLQLSVHDLLDQNVSIRRSITDTYIEDRQTIILHRFFMLKLIYNLRKFGAKEKKHNAPHFFFF